MKSIWSGNISFGLINIPVKLYSASVSRALSFKFLRKKDLCPIRNVRVCSETGEQVMYNDIVRGYEIEKNEFVVLDEKDFQRADINVDQVIDVIQFVPASEVKPEMIVRPYYIESDKKAEKAYAIFREALKRTERVAIANFVMKTREHLAAIVPEDDLLILIELRYADEIKDVDDINVPNERKIAKGELDMAVKLIDAMSGDFEPQKFHDQRSEELKKIIKQKAKGKLPKIEKKQKTAPTPARDIMAQLKESLEMTKKK